jgi:thiamine-monophosphate kinase
MPQGEFELIGRYFARLGAERSDVRIGGDDGAVIMPPASRELVASPTRSKAALPGDLRRHRLAIAPSRSISDLAAMGAEPAWGLLALTILMR